MFRFITDRPFWVNALVILVISGLLIFGVLELLGVITNHGKYLTVPSVVGKKTEDAIKMLEEKGFDVEIQDSIYTDTAAKGIVLKQIPDPSSTVKINRTVLLTVNRKTLPMVDMPALEGKSLNFALEIMKRSHLTLGDTLYRPDFMKGSIIEQNFHGTRIRPGSKLPWGSRVDLVIGSGLNDEPILVPELVGLTFEEAKMVLQENGIIIGAIVADDDVKDSSAAYIWKQLPPRYNELKEPVFIQSGQLLDIWLTTDLLKHPATDTLIINKP